MRVIAVNTVRTFCQKHPSTRQPLARWVAVVKSCKWATTLDVQSAFPKAKVLNSERVRFEIAGGDYRLIAAFDFKRGIVFVKFIGTHADYDRIDALTVAEF